MTTDTRISITRLRQTAQHHGRDNTTLELSPLEVLDLIAVVEAAQKARHQSPELAAALSRFDP